MLNIGKEEAQKLVKEYINNKVKGKTTAYGYVNESSNVTDLLDWLASGNIKDMIEVAPNASQTKEGVIRYVELYKPEGKLTQEDLNDKYKDLGIVSETKSGLGFKVNIPDNVTNFFFDCELNDAIIRMYYSIKEDTSWDSVIYFIKKTEVLEDVRVITNRIPSSMLVGRDLEFIQTDNDVGYTIRFK